MMRQFLALAAAGLLLPTSASAQVQLKQKFNENSTAEIRIENKTNQTLTLNGADIPTKVDQLLVMTSTTGQAAADGTLNVEVRTTDIQAETSLPGGASITFDSANPEAPIQPGLEMFSELYKTMLKSTQKFTYKDGKLVNVAILPDGVTDNVNDLFKELFDPDYIKTQHDIQRHAIPDDPVNVGDTWERTAEAKFGGGQVMTFTTQYKYTGTVQKDGRTLHRIESTTTDVDFDIQGGALPVKLKNSDLKTKDSGGVTLFDVEAGQIVESSEKVQIVGPLAFDANGMELAGELDLVVETKTTVKVK